MARGRSRRGAQLRRPVVAGILLNVLAYAGVVAAAHVAGRSLPSDSLHERQASARAKIAAVSGASPASILIR